MTSAVFEALNLEIRRSPLSIYKISAKSGVHDITMRYWLSGRTKNARRDTLEKVARAIDKRLELSDGRFGLQPYVAQPTRRAWRYGGGNEPWA
jgi:hypothetical protein